MTGFRNAMMGAAGAAGAGGFAVDNSAMFNNNQYLLRTPGTAATSDKINTVSFWFKRGKLGTTYRLLNGRNSGGTGAYQLGIGSNDKFNFHPSISVAGEMNSTMLFRDPHAWYHVVCSLDTTQGTEADRYGFWVNGVDMRSDLTGAKPAQNLTVKLNENGVNQVIAAYQDASFMNYWDGYLAEFVVIDGAKLDADQFGEYDTNGVWRPIDVSGLDYGNNGYYLNFAASGSSLGDDASGNSNDFTPTNSPTQTNDSPTKNYAVLSPLTHQTNGDLSKGNTQTTTGSADQGLSFSTFPVTTGQKVYIEALCSGATTCMTGCVKATSAVVQNPLSDFDALESADGGAGRLLHVATGDVFNSDGNTSATNYAPNDSVPVTHMIALDLVNDKIYWGDAGVGASGWSNGSGSFNQSFDNAVGVDLTANLDWFFAFRPFTGTIEVNFGATAFTVDPPTGYSSGYSAAIENENRETSLTIEDPDDHFKEVIVDHDGSSTNFTIPWSTYNGTNGTYDTLFSIKRLADEKWFVIDSIRGLTKYFSWNATTSQTTDANVLSVSGTTGTLGSTLANDNYLVQMYRLNAQSSRDTNNSEGSITGGSNSLIISANATAGWSVCTYTGTGANGTFGHGLSQAPEWIRWYNTVSADGQTVYHAFNPSTPKDHYGNFDSAPTTLTNDDSTKFNDTAPTADVNSVGSADSTNGSSDTMWCFSVHSVNSFSKVGAFVGNGNANGPFAEASISPKSVVLKNANGSASGDDWYLVTDTRFLYNGDASTLAFNLTATEQATNLFDMVSNGIKLRTTNAGVNENTNTIVYQIIGSPFAGTTPATAR